MGDQLCELAVDSRRSGVLLPNFKKVFELMPLRQLAYLR